MPNNNPDNIFYDWFDEDQESDFARDSDNESDAVSEHSVHHTDTEQSGGK